MTIWLSLAGNGEDGAGVWLSLTGTKAEGVTVWLLVGTKADGVDDVWLSLVGTVGALSDADVEGGSLITMIPPVD